MPCFGELDLFWYRRASAIVLLCFFAFGSAWASGGLFSSWGKQPELLEAVDVFQLDNIHQQGDRFEAKGIVTDGYYVYRHSLKLVNGQGEPVDLALSAGTAQHDEFFGDTEIYTGDMLRLDFPADTSGPLTLHWQGCADVGFCYPPQTLQVDLPSSGEARVSPDASITDASVSDNAAPSAEMGEDQQAAQRLATLGPVAGTLLFFGFGLLLAFTPCTLPMIPIVSSMVVGSQARPARAFMLSLCYVVAMAATYAAVGVAAGLAGANLQATLQSPWLLG